MKSQPRYQPGDRIGGRYEVHQALMGGMGEVYLCLDMDEMYPYALKTFQQRYWTSHALRKAFENEVATWVALEKHPNIVHCFHLDTLDNRFFMILEWIAGDDSRGTDLRSWLRYGSLDLRLSLDLIIDVCRGLVHAQEKCPGLVHRDLKPENILISQHPMAKITDWGLAQTIQIANLKEVQTNEGNGRNRDFAGRGSIVGTPEYMAPEQWIGGALDVRTDIYAVGCILYELLSGIKIFQATTLSELCQLHCKAPIPRLPAERGLPRSLDVLLESCLAKECTERPRDATVLLEELQKIYQRQFASGPRPVGASQEFTASDYNNRAVTYDKLGLYDKALADYNMAIQIDPTSAIAHTNRGVTLAKMGRYQEALADQLRAVQLDPDYATAFNNLGNVYYVLRQYDKAFDAFAKAMQLAPADPKAFHNRANMLADLHRYDLAIEDYTHAIQLAPTAALVYLARGNAYRNLWRLEEALADYERVTELDPANMLAHGSSALIYSNLQRYDEALKGFTRAIELDPENATSYFNRGNVCLQLGRSDEALADYFQATKIDPSFAEAYCNAGSVLANRGSLQEALPYFERAQELGDPLATQRIVQVRQELGILSREPLAPHTLALEAFWQANSLDEMYSVVAQFRFMTDRNFVDSVETLELGEKTGGSKSGFRERLGWLHQVVSDSNFLEMLRQDELAFEAFLSTESLGDMRDAAGRFPFMTTDGFIDGIEQFSATQVEMQDQPAVEQRLAWLRQVAYEHRSNPQLDPAQQAFEAFQRASSIGEMRNAVEKFPFMTLGQYISNIEQVIAKDVPIELRHVLGQRLGWLRQIANEQKREKHNQ